MTRRANPLFGSSMPAPFIDEDTREFWVACREHRLIVQQCKECQSFRFAPVPICYNCRSFNYRWVESEGVGEIYTWTVIHRAVHPAAESAVPYNAVVVKLMDCGGALLTSNVVDIENDDIAAGMKVRVVWEDVSSDLALPRFRPF
jgi:uncharacterized OB-fold protein